MFCDRGTNPFDDLFARDLAQFSQCQELIKSSKRFQVYGRLLRATGLVLEASGIRLALGANCAIAMADNQVIEAEVVGFTHDRLFLMPYVTTQGIIPGAKVIPLNRDSLHKKLPCGLGLLGRVLDARGQVLDQYGPLEHIHYCSLETPPINPLTRSPIEQPLDVGIRVINAALTIGRGQRLGLFAGSGVGKSVLLGMMARFTQADIIVVALIGERGREVKDFIENILGRQGLQRAVVIAAPADCSALLRIQGAVYATRIAEDFRQQGHNVLLIMDSLTRYAMAIREIALAVGEPPATKGYPPSVFARLPALVERAGNGDKNEGSITAFYTVLTEGDDLQDPIADAARAILDGHIVLSRRLAEAGHYPAIDIEASISRAMTSLINPTHYRWIQKLKQLIAYYQRNHDLISVGAYVAGSDALLDEAIHLMPKINDFLTQDINQATDYSTSVSDLEHLITN